jgi:hypothetical protein
MELHEIIAPDSLRYELWLRTAPSLLPVLGKTERYFTELFRLIEDPV